MMKMDDIELMIQIQKGDEVAFEEIVRRYKDKIVNFLYQINGDYQKAAELAQETFMRVYFKANSYRPIAPLSSWIYTIASNLAKTEIKRSRRMRSISYDDYQNDIRLSDTGNDPTSSSMVVFVRKALNTLHPRYRIPLILKDIEGYSQEEIAEILKKPIGTIKARISRGRDYLKKEIEKSSDVSASCVKQKEFENGRA